jgi:cyclic-di-GMP-binding protein
VYWNKSKRSDHPMVDRQHAEEFLRRLPRDDPSRMLEEISFWLKALRDAYGVVPQRAFEVVDLLDVTAKAPQLQLASDFVALGSRYHRFQAQRTWNVSFQFSRELGATYQHLLDQYRRGVGVGGSEALKPYLPMIVARAIRALRVELKWSLLRQGPVDSVLWKLAGTLYGFAEEAGLAAENLKLYPGATDFTSAQLEYLQVLMLSVSATDTLAPEMVHLVDSVVERHAEFFAITRRPRRGVHYFVDLAGAGTPARLVDRVAPAASIRYFGPDKAASMLDRLIDSIGERGMVPSELNPGGMHKAAAILEVLDHLVRYWDPTPPTRASERTSTLTRISVVHDFGSVLGMVSGESQELDFDSNVETWNVENESQGGYGAVITETASDWLEIGSLVGIKEEEGASWGIGLVRRLTRPAAGKIYVGIESLSRGVVKVNLSRASSQAPGPPAEALLLLSSREGSAQTSEVTLMLPTGTFSPGETVLMYAFGRRYPLRPKQLRERGAGYEVVRFQVESAEENV